MTFNSTPRKLPWRLRGVTAPVQVTSGDSPDDTTLQWPVTNPDTVVSMEVRLSLNECVALASAVDVGRDIAYGNQSEELWLLWARIWKEACVAAMEAQAHQSQSLSGSSAPFDDLLKLLEDIGVKFVTPDGKTYEAAINLIECGCGTSSDESSVTGGAPGGTSGELFSGDIPTLCDLIAGNFAQYLADRMDDIAGRIQNKIFAIDAVTSALDIPIANSYLDVTRDNLTDITAQLQDATFRNTLNQAMAKFWNDPVSPPLTRIDLLNIARYINVEAFVQEGAPMFGIAWLWAASDNLSEINTALRTFVGLGDPNVCAPYFAAAGRQPSGSTGSGPGLTTSVFQQGADQWELRIYAINQNVLARTDPDAIELPFDYTDLDVGAAGIISTNILLNDPNGNDNPRAYYNNDTGALFTSGIVAAYPVSSWHTWSRSISKLTTATQNAIIDTVEQVTGYAIDETVGIVDADILAPEISIASVAAIDGAIEIAYAYTVHKVE